MHKVQTQACLCNRRPRKPASPAPPRIWEAAFAQQSGAEISYQKSLTYLTLAYANAQVSKEQAAFDKAHDERCRPVCGRWPKKQKFPPGVRRICKLPSAERKVELSLQNRNWLEPKREHSNSSKASLDAAHSKVTAARAQVAQSKANEKQVVERVADAAAAKASIG